MKSLFLKDNIAVSLKIGFDQIENRGQRCLLVSYEKRGCVTGVLPQHLSSSLAYHPNTGPPSSEPKVATKAPPQHICISGSRTEGKTERLTKPSNCYLLFYALWTHFPHLIFPTACANYLQGKFQETIMQPITLVT